MLINNHMKTPIIQEKLDKMNLLIGKYYTEEPQGKFNIIIPIEDYKEIEQFLLNSMSEVRRDSFYFKCWEELRKQVQMVNSFKDIPLVMNNIEKELQVSLSKE